MILPSQRPEHLKNIQKLKDNGWDSAASIYGELLRLADRTEDVNDRPTLEVAAYFLMQGRGEA